MNNLPQSIAIAGAWGYIGRKFLDAALALGLRTYVYDPGPAPADLNLTRFHRIANEKEFYQLDADLFHLAIHPEQRKSGMTALLERSLRRPILILVEKPMALPEQPEECRRIIEAVGRSKAVVLYDFPELFDPMTQRIREFLAGFRDVKIGSIYVQRSKDREDPANPRNYKRMVHIQYQESVHCLAFALSLLAAVDGDLDSVFDRGLSVTATSEPYCPPNPQDYPCVVDGKCDFILTLGEVEVVGHTNFKKGAESTKRRIIKGTGDGNPFVIDVDYQEGRKRLVIDGEYQRFDPAANSYENVIKTLWRWYKTVPAEDLMHGLYPHPEFARLTYQLSSVVWRSCWDRERVNLPTAGELRSWGTRVECAIKNMPQDQAAATQRTGLESSTDRIHQRKA